MHEMVFLSVLSSSFDFDWGASDLYLWGYSFVVLAKGFSCFFAINDGGNCYKISICGCEKRYYI